MEYLSVDVIALIYNKLNIDDLENLFTAKNNYHITNNFG